MRRLRSIQYVILVSLGAALTTACGSDLECGDGTTERGDVCVSTTTGGDTNANANANGNQNDNTNTNANANANTNTGMTTCGAGTELQNGECVPVASLASFGVTATAVDCDDIVDGVTPVAVAITALDADGATLSSFSEAVSLVGLGGITITPSTVMLTSGSGTVNVTVNGLTDNAEILAFNSTSTVSGRSLAFPVVAETLELTGLTTSLAQLRSGETVDLSVSLETNGCRPPPMDAEGIIALSADNGVVLSPNQILLDGTSGITQTVSVDGAALGATTNVNLAATLGLQSTASATLSVIPPLVFTGISDAIAIDADTVRVSFNAATGGEPLYSYTVYRSEVAGTLGTAFTPALTGVTSGEFSVAGVSNGVTSFFTVRVADSLSSTIDNNLVQLSVTKGDVVYVDSSNVGTANGGPGTPYTSLRAAIAELPSGGTINISQGSYAELPILFMAAGTQIVGGFSGFMGAATQASDWVRGETNTVLNYDGTSILTFDDALLSVGTNSTLTGLDIAPEILPTTAGAFVDAVGTVELRDTLVGSTTELNARRIRGAGVALTVIGSTLRSPATSGPTCIEATDSNVTLVDSLLEGSNTAVDLSPGTGSAASLDIQSSTFRNANTAAQVAQGTLTVRDSRFEMVTTALLADDGTSVDVDNTDFVDNTRAIELNNASGIIVTRSRGVGVGEGIEGSLLPGPSGRSLIRVEGTQFATVEGTGIEVRGTPTNGAFDLNISNNQFSTVGSSSAGVQILIANNDPLEVHTAIIANNHILDFNRGIDLLIREGDGSTTAGEISVASIIGNYARG
ncbi:MAG: hypothetical protein AAF658_03785, partial [Myxococcota bacterium]